MDEGQRHPKAGQRPGPAEDSPWFVPGEFVEPVSLRDYVKVLVRRRWAVMTFVAAVVSLTAVFTLTARPIYRATTRIMIEKESPRILNIKDILPMETTGTDFYQTQYKILESRSLARRVIEQLDLSSHPDFNPPPSGIFASQNSREGVVPIEVLISRFLASFTVQPIRNSRLVDVSFDSASPELASKVANAVTRAYIDMNLEVKFHATKQAVEWLNREIAEQKAKLEESEQAVQQYSVEAGLISVQDRQDIASQRLSQLNSDLIRAESARIVAEERYRHIERLVKDGMPLETIPEVANNSLVQGLKAQAIRLITEMSEMAQQYGDKHPKMIRARAELTTLQDNIRKTSENLVATLENEYLVAAQQEKRMRKAMEDQTQELHVIMEKSIRYRVLAREVETNKQLYETLLKRFKEANLSEDIRATNVRIVDQASVPLAPAGPKKARNLLLALVVGLFGGVGLAFFLEYLDDTIRDPDDVERRLGIANLGMIPAIKADQEDLGKGGVECVVHSSPRSPASEAIRGLRTNLLFSAPHHPPRVVTITSASPLEGKTTTAVNLAISLAQLDKKVLLVDADMRKPRLHQIFGLDNQEGLSLILVGSGAPRPFGTFQEHLDLMPCGPVPPNPIELLSSQAMVSFLEEQRRCYDFVVIDTPPVGVVSDARVLGRLSEGTLMVLKAGKTPRQQIVKAVSALAELEIRILGAVLNLVDVSRDRYYYTRYYDSYGDYYGEGKAGKTS